jgi:hypothetical protein
MIKIAIIMGLFNFIASLFGCAEKPQMLDGPGMEYVDSDYRSAYANALEFDWDEAKSKKLRNGTSEMTVTWRVMNIAKDHVYCRGTTTGYG